jgi:hypothetical protein
VLFTCGVYSGAIVTFEASNTTHSAVFAICNISIPGIQVNANNYLPNGTITTNGEGNNTFNNLNFRSAYVTSNIDQIPALQFLPARNVVSDTRINNIMCEGLAGACIGAGFETKTNGTVATGSSVIPVLDGTSLVDGMGITIVGSGASGGILNAFI